MKWHPLETFFLHFLDFLVAPFCLIITYSTFARPFGSTFMFIIFITFSRPSGSTVLLNHYFLRFLDLLVELVLFFTFARPLVAPCCLLFL